MSHEAEQAIRIEPLPPDVSIEFLAALPVELRVEVLEQARREARRNAAPAAAGAAGAGAGAGPGPGPGPAAPPSAAAAAAAAAAVMDAMMPGLGGEDMRLDLLFGGGGPGGALIGQVDRVPMGRMMGMMMNNHNNPLNNHHHHRRGVHAANANQQPRVSKALMQMVKEVGHEDLPGEPLVPASGLVPLVRLLSFSTPTPRLNSIFSVVAKHAETRGALVKMLLDLVFDPLQTPTTWHRALFHLASLAKGNPRVADLLCLRGLDGGAAASSSSTPPALVSLLGLLGRPAFVEHRRIAELLILLVSVALSSARAKHPDKSAEVLKRRAEERASRLVLSSSDASHLLATLDADVESGTLSRFTLRAVNSLLSAISGGGAEQVAAVSGSLVSAMQAMAEARAAAAEAELGQLHAHLSRSDLEATPLPAPTRTGLRLCRLLRCLRSVLAHGEPRAAVEWAPLRGLWAALGRVLSLVEAGAVKITSSRSPAVVATLPYIEALFFAHAPSVSQLTAEPDNPFPGELARFVETYCKATINVLVKDRPQLVEPDGCLHSIAFLQRVLDFDVKRLIFRSRVRKLTAGRPRGTLRLHVRRSHLFEDTFQQTRGRTAEEMRGKLQVEFMDEQGIDAGGLSREFFSVLAREIFNPGYALFCPSAHDSLTFQPNMQSYINPDHVAYFHFIGRIIAKALTDGFLLDAHFTRSFYKHLLGRGVTFDDLEAVDPAFHKSLKWMLDNPIEGVIDMNFTAELDRFGVTEVVELKPGGKDIQVDDSNKAEYVALVVDHRLTTAIRTQIDAFVRGFRELAPPHLTQPFSEQELELLISGLPDIDVHDLRANTEYTGYTATSPVIIWFWEVVAALSSEDKAHLVQFVTGTSKVPLDGFKSLQGMNGPQKFNIQRIADPSRLPSAHTCTNQLDLPPYSSRDELRDKLIMAIRDKSGFGLV
jgi:hypothetical protein